MREVFGSGRDKLLQRRCELRGCRTDFGDQGFNVYIEISFQLFPKRSGALRKGDLRMLPGTTGCGQSKRVAFIGQAYGGPSFLLTSEPTPVSDY